MKPVLVLGAGLVALAGMQGSEGTFRPSTGAFGYQAPRSSLADAYYGAQRPRSLGGGSYAAPRSAYGSGVIGAERFQPYRGQSVYSNRGGLNAYPSAPRPKGYLSPYGAGGTSVYTSPYSR